MMIFVTYLPFLAFFIIIFTTLTVVIEALPINQNIVQKEEKRNLNERIVRSNIVQRRSSIPIKISPLDQERLLKRGIIRSRIFGPNFDQSFYYANKKKRFFPINYPIKVRIVQMENNGENSYIVVKKRQNSSPPSSSTTSIPTANVSPTSVNHDTSDSTTRTSVTTSNPSADPAPTAAANSNQPSNTTTDPPHASPIQLPKDVTPASEGFLFLPVSKSSSNDGGNKDNQSNQPSTSTSNHQTFFFNIEAPNGGQVSSFQVNGGKPAEPSSTPPAADNSSNKSISQYSDSIQPSSNATAIPDKTRIIFKPLADPESAAATTKEAPQQSQSQSGNQDKSAPSPFSKPSNNDVSKSDAGGGGGDGNNEANKQPSKPSSTRGASSPKEDNKSPDDDHDHDSEDDKSPTKSQSTEGSEDEKKKDSGKSNPTANNTGDGGGGNIGQDGGNKNKSSPPDKSKDDGGSGGGGGDGGDGKDKKSDAGQSDGGKDNKSSGSGGNGDGGGKENQQSDGGGNKGDGNNNAGTTPVKPKTSPPPNGKEDDYYLFPVEQEHKTVDLNKGDMVAYVDHPQSAAQQFTGGSSQKRDKYIQEMIVPFQKREIIHTFHLKARRLGDSLSSILLVRSTVEPKQEEKLLNRVEIQRDNGQETRLSSSFKVRLFNPITNPFKHIFTRSFLQPGLQKATVSFWYGPT